MPLLADTSIIAKGRIGERDVLEAAEEAPKMMSKKVSIQNSTHYRKKNSSFLSKVSQFDLSKVIFLQFLN